MWWFSLAYAQELGQLRALVVDDEHELPIHEVTLRLSGEALRQEMLSDAHGEALFTELPPGTYQLVASKEGMGSVTATHLEVLPGLTTPAVVLLHPPEEDVWAVGQLRLVVVDDEEELPIHGVTLQLSGETLIGGVWEKLSDANGEALFTNLPPGLYRVVSTKPGFGGVTLENIQVSAGRTTVQTVKQNTCEIV